jgi:hypothetical protein
MHGDDLLVHAELLLLAVHVESDQPDPRLDGVLRERTRREQRQDHDHLFRARRPRRLVSQRPRAAGCTGSALLPAEVAWKRNDFLILTHPEVRAVAEERAQAVLGAFDAYFPR